MHQGFITIMVGAFASLLICPGASAAPKLKLHAVAIDPLIKVFQDDKVAGEKHGSADAARGEHATFQVVVTSSPVELKDLHCDVTTFTQTAGTGQLLETNVRYVGYVASSYSGSKPASDQLRPAPAMYPDPLLETTSTYVAAGSNQPVWITVNIPIDAEPGDYMATSVLTAKLFGVDTSTTIPLKLKVYPATITKTRLNVTNWFQMWHRGDQPMPEKFSPAWWDVMRTYIRNMAEHRQNWARVETLWLLKYTGSAANGDLKIDFTNFDKWVQMLVDEGMEKIESLQYAWRGGKWEEPYVVEIHDGNDIDYKGRRVPVDSPEAEEFYSVLFPAFHAHLTEKGWLDKFVQHVGDEPVVKNADSYTTASNLLRKYAPGIPIMEACLAHNMVGAIDIWVPTVEHLGQDFKFYQERKAAGEKVWFYTCVQPQGEYANRFIDLPLIKTRLLHWINYRYDIDGYLHWGYNFWRPHPWDNTADGSKLPGGDTHIVYPAKDSLGIVESIRWEAMRDGIEDHELLSQLGEKNPEAAMELAKKHVLDFDKYNTDVEAFRATRKTLLEALSKE